LNVFPEKKEKNEIYGCKLGKNGEGGKEKKERHEAIEPVGSKKKGPVKGVRVRSPQSSMPGEGANYLWGTRNEKKKNWSDVTKEGQGAEERETRPIGLEKKQLVIEEKYPRKPTRHAKKKRTDRQA